VAAGDTLDMRLQVEGSRLGLAFAHNGTPLGEAFDIEGWSGGPVRPVVSLSSAGQRVSLAASTGAEFTRRAGPGEGVAGSWQGEDLQVTIEAEGEGRWSVGAKVGNSMSCQVTQAGDQLSVGPVTSTRMMAPPHLQARETAVSQLLAGLTGLAREGGSLRLTAGERSEVLAPAQGLPPATRERVNWLK